MTVPATTPELSDDLLVYRFDRKGRPSGPESDFERAVIIDRGHQAVHFWNCHTPRAFFALRSQPLVSFRFDEILAVYRCANRGAAWLEVLTRAGKATVPRTGPGDLFEELHQQLRVLAPNDIRAPAEEHPLILPVYVVGGIGGMLALLYATPRNSGPPVLILSGLLGILLGVAGVFWTVRLAHRWFGVKLALPLGLAVLGALAGVFAFFSIVCAFVQGNGIHLCILLALGTLAGVTTGVVLERRKSSRRSAQE